MRTPPCRVLTLAADSDSEWSQAGKPMVRYTLDGREFTAATNAAAVDVCKGTVTLRVGAVLNVLVYVRRDEMQVRVRACRGVTVAPQRMAGSYSATSQRKMCVACVVCRVYMPQEALACLRQTTVHFTTLLSGWSVVCICVRGRGRQWMERCIHMRKGRGRQRCIHMHKGEGPVLHFSFFFFFFFFESVWGGGGRGERQRGMDS